MQAHVRLPPGPHRGRSTDTRQVAQIAHERANVDSAHDAGVVAADDDATSGPSPRRVKASGGAWFATMRSAINRSSRPVVSRSRMGFSWPRSAAKSLSRVSFSMNAPGPKMSYIGERSITGTFKKFSPLSEGERFRQGSLG